MIKKLGIIGGMGPEATVNMYAKIVRLTEACNDQEHLEIFIHNNNNIPDRTEAILRNGRSPVSELSRSAHFLEQSGADVIIIPCITSHYFFDRIQERINIPIINAIQETAAYISQRSIRMTKVGVIATTGTIQSHLFQKELTKAGISVIVPGDNEQQNLVMNAIYGENGIKAGYLEGASKQRILETANILIAQGAEAIIAGCTEIPLVLSPEAISVPLMDPIEILAESAIAFCGARVRHKV